MEHSHGQLFQAEERTIRVGVKEGLGKWTAQGVGSPTVICDVCQDKMTKDDKGIWLKVVLVLGALLPGFSLLMILVVGISNEGKDRLAKFVKEKGINYSIASAKD